MLRATLVAALLLPALGAVAQPGPPAGAHRLVPCLDCHPGAPGGGGPVACGGCHEPSAHLHPTGVRPSFAIPPGFPAAEGLLGCATCHRLHGPAGDSAPGDVVTAGPADRRRFCFGCHGDGLAAEDPHRAREGARRCAYCHAPAEVAAILGGAAPRPGAGARRRCEVCHDLGTSDHPRNIDPVLDLPAGLPLGPGGEVTCVTCHDPHGSSHHTHHIREAYARHFERSREQNPHRDDRFACAACHTRRVPEEITPRAHELRFQGDGLLLCISCHARARSHHPVGMALPGPMAGRLGERGGGVPLGPEGRLVCTTCHTNNCATGQQRMSVRRYDPRRMDLTLCWLCHAKEEFARTDPHRKVVAGVTEGCVFCHDRAPVKGLERGEDLYFVSQVKMICLRCHEDLSDSDVSHMGRTPGAEILDRLARYGRDHAVEFPLDREGRFTCTTCHNAHFSAKDDRHKTRLPGREMCQLCHQR
ncbi:MAG: cytochrome c3 family protein [Deferrisomatales bacterium]